MIDKRKVQWTQRSKSKRTCFIDPTESTRLDTQTKFAQQHENSKSKNNVLPQSAGNIHRNNECLYMRQRVTETRTKQETQCQASSVYASKKMSTNTKMFWNATTRLRQVTRTSSLSKQPVVFIDNEALEECLPMAKFYMFKYSTVATFRHPANILARRHQSAEHIYQQKCTKHDKCLDMGANNLHTSKEWDASNDIVGDQYEHIWKQ